MNFIKAWRNDKLYNKRVLIWRFTLVLIKINYGQIGDQTGLFYTTNPVFYTSGNRFVRRTGMFGNLIFSLVPSDNRNTRSTCLKSVFTGIGQTLMLRPDMSYHSDTLFWFKPISLTFSPFMLCALRRSNKYQFYSLWFDPTRAPTHEHAYHYTTDAVTPS